ncbi:hypothetical protein VNI00_004904 [Paramarasmius palmivorus]|uniref:Uncharacterized protein n=1 Tax=Paramarasmius palmivorus TaxID=297713 RepID=A0AAW0DKL7_9AGAR
MTRTREVVEGNSVRIAFTLSEIQNLGRETELNRFEVYYKLQPVQEWRRFIYAWLVQANHSFSLLGIQDDCRNYSFLNGFWLCLERKPVLKHPGGRFSRLKPASTTIYLIIRPVPSPSDETQTWSNWASGAKYFWSFDESDGTELPEEICDSLGLCSFTTSIVIDHTWWDRNGYDEIQMFYHSEGIESPSTHLATLLGYPIFQIADSDHTEKADSQADSNAVPLNIDPNPSQQGTSPFQTRVQWLRMRRLGFPYYMRTALPEEWDIDFCSMLGLTPCLNLYM